MEREQAKVGSVESYLGYRYSFLFERIVRMQKDLKESLKLTGSIFNENLYDINPEVMVPVIILKREGEVARRLRESVLRSGEEMVRLIVFFYRSVWGLLFFRTR